MFRQNNKTINNIDNNIITMLLLLIHSINIIITTFTQKSIKEYKF